MRFYTSHTHATEILCLKIDRRCKLYNTQHVRSFCRFSPWMAGVNFAMNLQQNLHEKYLDFAANLMRICSEIHGGKIHVYLPSPLGMNNKQPEQFMTHK